MVDFSVCGFGNALSFQDCTDEDIPAIAHVMREKWAPIMQKERKEKGDSVNMIDHFGKIYSKNPEQFNFMPGDKKLINALATHVRKVIGNHGLKHFVKTDNTAMKIPNKSVTEYGANVEKTHFFLERLRSTAEKNEIRKVNGYRYDTDIKLIATYLRLISGPLAYDTVQRNLECCLPALSSVNRYIRKSSCNIVEGVLRKHELLLYLTERNLPLHVILSEDETRIVGKVQYDAKTNQIVGFTLPLNKTTGLPTPFTYNARDAKEIISHFSVENSISSYLTVMMAQPLAQNVPAFCLLAYGSDNKYTAADVCNRWDHVREELASLDIRSWSNASDSEPRFNSAMRQRSMLGQSGFLPMEWFSAGKTDSYDFQDPIHIATKSRNRFLRTNLNGKLMPFGRNNFISVSHLYFIIKCFTKDRHELSKSTLNPVDKQNFKSVEKMCSEKVLRLLRMCVKNSRATVQYLEMIRDVTDAFRDQTLTPEERIRKIWYRVFVLRLWRRFILNNKIYHLKDQFLTTNCYSCIELNAHSLIQIILHLREINKPELFLPHLFGSQQCESVFRQMRSMTSTFSTVANCSTKEALSRLSKIQLQNDIMQMTSGNFKYPRLATKTESVPIFSLPSLHEICTVVDQCADDAKELALDFNLITSDDLKEEDLLYCKIKPILKSQQMQRVTDPKPLIQKKPLKISDFNGITLKNFAAKKNSIDKISSFVELEFNDKAKRVVVKKSSFVWLLRKDCQRISSDRLRRVQAANENSDAVRTYRPKRAKKCLLYRYKRPTRKVI